MQALCRLYAGSFKLYLLFVDEALLEEAVGIPQAIPAGRVVERRYVGIRLSIRRHTSQHTSAYVSAYQHTSAYVRRVVERRYVRTRLSIRRHTSQHTSAYVSTYVSIRQHTLAG